ncbi:phosphoribosyltransferase [bacterium]|nr:phosphoribosyltransferase [bacterium]
MIINAINSIYFDKTSKNVSRLSFGNKSKDSFEFSQEKIDEMHNLVKTYNSKGGTLTLEDLFNLGAQTKKYLDFRYKDYTVVCPGTSGAPLGNMLYCMGEDVIFLPISNARRNLDKFACEDNLRIVDKYLEKQGLSKDKKCLLIDYTFSGRSLENIQKHLRKKFTKNIKAVSLQHLFQCAFLFKLEKSCIDHYIDDCATSQIQNISNTPHFEIAFRSTSNKEGYINPEGKTDEEVIEEFENYSNPFAKAFIFLAFNNLW